MGIYLNPGNELYQKVVDSQVFVDHSMMIEIINRCIRTNQNYFCVSRPHRFGKSIDANMLCAYYSKGCDSSKIFSDLKIAETESYIKHLNIHNVIHLNIQNFLSDSDTIEDLIQLITNEIKGELEDLVSLSFKSSLSLPRVLNKIYVKYRVGFIFILDEWDCIFRYYRDDKESQKIYLDYLRNLFKDQPYVEFVYMTGILPIKKFGTHGGLNMFREISSLRCFPLEDYSGFTETEVHDLCNKFDMDYDKMKEWYGGYSVCKNRYNFVSSSVGFSIMGRKFGNYSVQSESYETIKTYISMNFDGLKEAIISLLAGESVEVNPDRFQNDMTSLYSKDDVLTLMIHLGYLGYNSDERTCYIPNKEVKSIFEKNLSDNIN